MSGNIHVTLTAAEASLLLSLIQHNEEDGIYYGPRDQYERRREGVRKKIMDAVRA